MRSPNRTTGSPLPNGPARETPSRTEFGSRPRPRGTGVRRLHRVEAHRLGACPHHARGGRPARARVGRGVPAARPTAQGLLRLRPGESQRRRPAVRDREGRTAGLPDRGVGRRHGASRASGCASRRSPATPGRRSSCTGARPTRSRESDGKAVFNESNGYVSVWHMNETGEGRGGHARLEGHRHDADRGRDRPGAALRGQAGRLRRRQDPELPRGRELAQHRGVVPRRAAERDHPRLGQRGRRARQQGAHATPQPAARPHRQRLLRRSRRGSRAARRVGSRRPHLRPRRRQASTSTASSTRARSRC